MLGALDSVSRAAASIRRVLARHVDLIALLLLMAAICNFGLITSDVPISRDSLNSLDESWEIDLVYKAAHGIWSGRDFSFTYGPLWQYLASVLPRAHGVSAGAVFKLLYLFSYWAAAVFAFLTARLLLPAVESWRRTVFLVALVVFWLSADARAGMSLFCFAVFLRLMERLPPETPQLMIRGFIATGLIAASFLMAGDSGALSAAGFAAVLVSALVLNWSNPGRKAVLRFAAASAAGMLFWVLAVNCWAAGPFHFQYWIWSAQIISAYRWLMAAPLAREAAVRLAETFAVCAAIFSAAWLSRDPQSDRVSMRPLFLLAGALFSGIALQKGVVRSGWGHLSQCMLPALALTGIILVGYRHRTRRYLSEITLLAAVALTVVFSGPAGLFRWSGVVRRVVWTAPPYPSCPPGTYYLDQACFLHHEYATFGPPSRYLRDHSGPGDPIVVYPYENLFGVLSGRRVSTGVLQNYAIGGEYLTRLQIAAIDRDRPPLGAYCTDEIVSWPVDGISNFQRTAPVWLYLQSHYVSEAEPALGVTMIRRDDARAARLQVVPHELFHASASGPAASASIDQVRWTASHADFLRLKLRVAYRPWWRILKPSAITAMVQLSDGTAKTARLAVEPDRLQEIWIYPWDESNLKDYFNADADRWRPAARSLPAVESVQVLAQRLDPLSVVPTSIEIRTIDGMELRFRKAP